MRIALTLAAALGVLAAAPLSTTLAAKADGLTTDLSAQTNQEKEKQKQTQKPAAKKPAQQRVQQPQHRPQHTQQNNKKPAASTSQKSVTTTTRTKNNNVTTTRSKSVTVKNNKSPRQVTFSSNRQTYSGIKARGWSRNGNWNYRGRNYSYWRGGPYRHRYGNSWRTYVALSALTAIAVGGATYYPYAYVDAPQDVCEGITEDGCQLTWTEAETVEGDVAPVCVTYCPWQ